MEARPLVICGDARALPLPDASVDLIVTSPPYWSLRAYQDGGEVYDGQIGSEATPAEYVDSLIDCTREWTRVLKPSGSLWVNLGDKYSDRANGGPSVAETNRADRASVRPAQPSTTAFAPPKSLLGLPWRYALACIDRLGLILRAEVIWSKPSALPESVRDRVRRAHEQWFWLTRWQPDASPPADLVRVVLEQVAEGVLTVDEAERLLTADMGSHETWLHVTRAPRYYSAVDEIRVPASDYARPNGAGRAPRGGQKPRKMLDTCNPVGKLPGSVWEVASEPLTVPGHVAHAHCCGGRDKDCEDGLAHYAAFPSEWPKQIIQGWSPPEICVECGEGRRPVVHKTRETYHGAGRWCSGQQQRADGAAVVGWAMDEKWSTQATISGYACACPEPTAPSRPSVVLDPFGGTGTTALVAAALGRIGITVDRSADYGRLATWRVNDPSQIAKVRGERKPVQQLDGQLALLDRAGL